MERRSWLQGTSSGWTEGPEPHGRADAFGGPAPEEETEMATMAGILWLPDPESRHGWREYYIKRPKPGAASRGAGFARRP